MNLKLWVKLAFVQLYHCINYQGHFSLPCWAPEAKLVMAWNAGKAQMGLSLNIGNLFLNQFFTDNKLIQCNDLFSCIYFFCGLEDEAGQEEEEKKRGYFSY